VFVYMPTARALRRARTRSRRSCVPQSGSHARPGRCSVGGRLEPSLPPAADSDGRRQLSRRCRTPRVDRSQPARLALAPVSTWAARRDRRGGRGCSRRRDRYGNPPASQQARRSVRGSLMRELGGSIPKTDPPRRSGAPRGQRADPRRNLRQSVVLVMTVRHPARPPRGPAELQSEVASESCPASQPVLENVGMNR
jgi:hypothetical protein